MVILYVKFNCAWCFGLINLALQLNYEDFSLHYEYEDYTYRRGPTQFHENCSDY